MREVSAVVIDNLCPFFVTLSVMSVKHGKECTTKMCSTTRTFSLSVSRTPCIILSCQTAQVVLKTTCIVSTTVLKKPAASSSQQKQQEGRKCVRCFVLSVSCPPVFPLHVQPLSLHFKDLFFNSCLLPISCQDHTLTLFY